MIRLTLEPTELAFNQNNSLSIRLTNVGRIPYTHLALRLKLPAHIVLLEGSEKLEVTRIDPRQCLTHTILVRPRQVGTCTLTTTSFSYRDVLGQPQYPQAPNLEVKVVSVTPKQETPEPEIAVSLTTTELLHREWGLIEGQITNSGQTTLYSVALTARGPITSDSHYPWHTIGVLSPGEKSQFRLFVRADEIGSKVPIYIEVVYSDESGRPRHYEQQTPIRVTAMSNEQSCKITPVTVLFLASDPTDASRLRLGEELRDIREQLQMARKRDEFVLHDRMSIRTKDISQALLDVNPQIVHFSGHGMSSGALCFENDSGETHPVQPDALAGLFSLVASHVQCVVLNACFSEIQANAIVEHVKYVIGMSQAIGDKAAIAFAVGFYQALCAGRSIEDAYKFGCVQIQMQGIPEYLTPVLKKK